MDSKLINWDNINNIFKHWNDSTCTKKKQRREAKSKSKLNNYEINSLHIDPHKGRSLPENEFKYGSTIYKLSQNQVKDGSP